MQRMKTKVIEQRKFLSHKTSRHVKSIVDKFPDIGETIELFVSESNVGADAWK